MAEYDLPTMVEAALRISRASQLYYVGHSQARAAFALACSLARLLARCLAASNRLNTRILGHRDYVR